MINQFSKIKKDMQRHGVEEEFNNKENKDNYIKSKNNRKEIGNIDNLCK